MTAFIGFCLEDGAFLAADAQRNHYDTGTTSTVKKIVDLTPQIKIATGGLGTIGHEARDEVREKVAAGDVNGSDLEAIISEIQSTFSAAYKRSLRENPGHGIPLYAILAGQRPGTTSGFICAMRSNSGFQAEFFDDLGTPYFTGSDTFLIRRVASAVHSDLKTRFGFLPLDMWATHSIQQLASYEREVGFPVQLTLTDSSPIDEFPVETRIDAPENKFKVNLDGTRI